MPKCHYSRRYHRRRHPVPGLQAVLSDALVPKPKPKTLCGGPLPLWPLYAYYVAYYVGANPTPFFWSATQTRANYGGLCEMPACGEAVGVGRVWCLRHAGALAWRRGPVCACTCTRVCWSCVLPGCWCRRICTYIHTSWVPTHDQQPASLSLNVDVAKDVVAEDRSIDIYVYMSVSVDMHIYISRISHVVDVVKGAVAQYIYIYINYKCIYTS